MNLLSSTHVSCFSVIISALRKVHRVHKDPRVHIPDFLHNFKHPRGIMTVTHAVPYHQRSQLWLQLLCWKSNDCRE